MVYSTEELTAELSSCYLMNLVGLESPESFKDSVAYLQGWSRALAGNKRLFVKAASDAAKACAYILGEEAEQNDP